MFHLAPHASDWYSPVYHIRWRVGGVVTQRIANPCTPVRFRYSPPNYDDIGFHQPLNQMGKNKQDRQKH